MLNRLLSALAEHLSYHVIETEELFINMYCKVIRFLQIFSFCKMLIGQLSNLLVLGAVSDADVGDRGPANTLGSVFKYFPSKVARLSRNFIP